MRSQHAHVLTVRTWTCELRILPIHFLNDHVTAQSSRPENERLQTALHMCIRIGGVAQTVANKIEGQNADHHENRW